MLFKLHPLYILLAGIYLVLGQGYIFFCYFLAVVLHEYAHVYSLKKYGIKKNNITLYPFGGQVCFSGINLKPIDEIKVAIAGPLANLLIASLVLSLTWLFPSTYPYTEVFYEANLFNGILNLLFIYPLDGGRILHALLSIKINSKKADKICLWLGFAFSGVLIIFGVLMCFYKNFSYLMLAIFLLVSQIELLNNNFSFKKLDRLKESSDKKIERIKEFKVPAQMEVYKILKYIEKKHFSIFHIIGSNQQIMFKRDENYIMNNIDKIDIYKSVEKELV